MATYKTDIATGQQAASVAGRVNGAKASGRIAYVDALYACNGAEINDDIIEVAELPIGANLLPDLCRVSCEAIGGTSPVLQSIGDAASDNRYQSTNIALGSEASTLFTPVVARMHTPWVITDATKVIRAKFGITSGNPTAGKKVRFRLAYLMP